MTDYREIIRLHSLKFSNVAIANSLCCSRNTVSEVLKLAETHSLEWPIPETLANRDIGHLFYPGRGNNEGRRLPDYEYVYGSCLYSDQKYLCITNERSHLYDEHYWMWPEISDIDNFDDSIPDVTDIMVLNSRGDEVYTATYYYCFGKPYFSEGCFVVYQDNDDKNLYRVFSYKNGYPRLTEIHVTGKIMTLAVDLDNNAIFIRSEESLFYIPADYRKELCLDSPTPELRKILKQLIGYDHVYGSKYSTECCERHYMLHITNDKYEQKTFHVRSENPDIYSLC